MSVFEIVTILIVLSALFSFVNHLWIGLPTTIGVMAITLVFSLALIGLDRAGLPVCDQAEQLLGRIEFSKALLHGMLGFLLFAGILRGARFIFPAWVFLVSVYILVLNYRRTQEGKDELSLSD